MSCTIIKELDKEECELILAYQNAEQDIECQNLLSEWYAIDDFNEK